MASAQKQDSFSVEKLTADNYYSWKFNMKMSLIGKDLWDIVEGSETLADDATQDARNKFRKRENQGLAMICLSITNSLQIYVRNSVTAKAAWDTLQNHFQEKTLSKKIYYRRKLYSTRMVKGTDIVTHINTLKIIAEHLQAVDDPVQDKDLVMILISSLPDDYNTLITTLETLDEEKLTWDYVRDRGIAEFERKKEGSSSRHKEQSQDALWTNKDKAYSKKKTKKNQKTQYRCHNCNEVGHFIRDCPKKKVDRTVDANFVSRKSKNKKSVYKCSSDDSDDEIALLTGDNSDCDDSELRYWWLDSGCSQHMTPCKSDLLNYRKFETPVNVNLADKTVVPAFGCGDVKVQLLNDSEVVPVVLKDVLFVPKLQNKLLSITSITKKGAAVQFEGNNCILTLKGKKYLFGVRQGKLWRLNSVDVSCNLVNEAESLKLWHLRMGHLNFNDVKLLSSDNMVSGLNLKQNEKIDVCEGCVMGKQKRGSFPKASTHRSKGPLDLIHSDVCGPMQVKSVGGSVSFLTFIDDFSRYVTIYIIKQKSDVERCFREFIQMAENQTGRRIKKLRADNGGEYISKDLNRFLKKHGILRDETIPYTPQQNGVAERMNRTLMESCRSMLHHAELPFRFWAEAVSTAVYLRNRSPTKYLNKTTPYEMWYGEKADVSNLKVFGCSTYVHIPDEKRRKLDKKSMSCIFVGYPSGSKGYKVYDPVKRRMFRSRDVIFLEDNFKCSNNEVADEHLEEVDEWLRFDVNHRTEVVHDVSEDEEASDEEVPVIQIPENVEVDVVIEDDHVDVLQDPDVGEEADRRSVRDRNVPDRFGEWVYASVVISECDDPRSFSEAMKTTNADEWKQAADAEMESLYKNNTWELTTLPKGKKAVGCKWVMKTKRDAEGGISRYKARLVAQGFSQKYGVDYDEVFAPVVKYSSIRSVLALANHYNMEIHQMDVKSAYLNSDIDTDIYMKQPIGYVDQKHPELVCKLNKSLYGLKQSARCWNKLIDEYLKSEGYVQNRADPCIYVKSDTRDNKKVLTIITLYVDDTIICCNDVDYLHQEKSKISSRFEMEDQGEIHYLLGMSIKRYRSSRTLTIDQRVYLEGVLKRFGMTNCKPVSTPMENGKRFQMLGDDEEGVNVREYQAVIGSLIYASIATRPDISAAVGVLSKFMVKPSSDHWTGVKRILRYIKGTLSYGLLFTNSKEFVLFGYSDADWAGDVDTRKSTSGYVFRLGSSTISWRSNKQSVIALSSTEAEYVALCQAVQEAVWLRSLLKSINLPQTSPTVVFEDNQSTIALSKNSCSNSRLKHVDIKFHYVKDVIKENVIVLQYCPTTEMVGDVFTKGLARPSFEKFRKLMGVDIVQ